MSTQPITRVAGPIVLGAGIVLLIQQIVMASFLDRSNIEATMASPLYVPTAVAYSSRSAGSSWPSSPHTAGKPTRPALRPRRVPRRPDRDHVPDRRPLVRGVSPCLARRHRAGRPASPGGMLVIGAFASMCFAVGWALFGLASLRARTFPCLCRSPSSWVGSSGSRRPCRRSRSRWPGDRRARSLDDRYNDPSTD